MLLGREVDLENVPKGHERREQLVLVDAGREARDVHGRAF